MPVITPAMNVLISVFTVIEGGLVWVITLCAAVVSVRWALIRLS